MTYDNPNTFEQFDGDLGSGRHFFLRDENTVLGVYPALNPANPRDNKKTSFVTFDEQNGLHIVGSNFGVPDTGGLKTFAWRMGAKLEEINVMPMKDVPAHAYSVIKGHGIPIIPITSYPGGNDKHYVPGFPDPDADFERFEGFIYDTTKQATVQDLKRELADYDAYINDEVYEAVPFDIDKNHNVIPVDAGEPKLFYGYDAEMTGFTKYQDIGTYLGTYESVRNIQNEKNIGVLQKMMRNRSVDIARNPRNNEIAKGGRKSADIGI